MVFCVLEHVKIITNVVLIILVEIPAFIHCVQIFELESVNR